MTLKTRQTKVQGVPICRGIAIGKPFSFTFVEDEISEIDIPAENLEKEVSRYYHAIKKSREDIRQLQEKLEAEGILDGVAILEAHLHMMDDPLLTTQIEEEIRSKGKNAEFIFDKIVSAYQKKFNSFTDPFFRERAKDVQDIKRRVMGYLRKSIRVSLADIPENSIIFAQELTPSDIAEANSKNVGAFVTEQGGDTSHAAIVAKAMGIPYVSNIPFNLLETANAERAVVDGRTGTVILNPSPQALLKYRDLRDQLFSHMQSLNKTDQLQAETFDGYAMRLSANIDVLNEMELLHQFGGCGVGLFRSECVFLTNETFPSEQEQYSVYKGIVEKMKGLPIVIRTFDVGGDKYMQAQDLAAEENPFLGCRAIRFLLRERDIFKTQLRAILRASAHGDVRIMFPMISALSEVVEAKAILEEAKEELRKSGEPMAKAIKVGCMIEVPSAAIVADLLAKECDFLSIGTNDLVQYSLAVDRGNQMVSGIYSPTDPSVIRLIKMIVSEANHQGIPVTVCGEVASDPRFTPLLLGLGVTELSVALRSMPVVKNAIRNQSIVAASQLAEEALTLSTAKEIEDLLIQDYKERVPDDCFYNF